MRILRSHSTGATGYLAKAEVLLACTRQRGCWPHAVAVGTATFGYVAEQLNEYGIGLRSRAACLYRSGWALLSPIGRIAAPTRP